MLGHIILYGTFTWFVGVFAISVYNLGYDRGIAAKTVNH